jgi:hypothetical protein
MSTLTPVPPAAITPPRVRDRRGLAIAVTFAAALAAVGWLRHEHYWSGGLDLGVFDQGVWLMSRGRVPDISLLGRNLFSDHLSPVLVLFALPYRLAATPAWLIAAQAWSIGATVLPLRALADDEGAPRPFVTAIVLLSAPLAAAAMFDFHPSTLATPFVAWTLLGARRGDARLTTWAAFAVVLCRADLGCVLLGIALVAQPSVRRRLLVIGAVAVVAGVVVPALLGNPGTWDPYYGNLGTGPFDALVHPWRVVRARSRRSRSGSSRSGSCRCCDRVGSARWSSPGCRSRSRSGRAPTSPGSTTARRSCRLRSRGHSTHFGTHRCRGRRR